MYKTFIIKYKQEKKSEFKYMLINMTRIASPKEMRNFGKKLAEKYKILLLQGDLGSGKTTLSKGFAEGLGINPSTVQSPTYAYINTYENKLLHIDMRRIEDYQELVKKGIIDQINEYEYILIERPKYNDKLPIQGAIIVNIKKTSPTTREVSLTNN